MPLCCKGGIYLEKQWEVRHPYRCFHYALKRYEKNVGWKTIFSYSSEIVTSSTELVSTAWCCVVAWGTNMRNLCPVAHPYGQPCAISLCLDPGGKVLVGEGVDGCRPSIRALATQGIKVELQLLCSAWVARTRGAHRTLFASPLLFIQPC